MIKKYLRGLLLKVFGSDWKKQYVGIKSIVTKDKLRSFQEKYLQELLLHASHNVPYYHNIFKEIGIVRNNLTDLSKFNKIPILTKEIIRKHYKELVSKDYITRKWYYNSSGGSTGEPVRFIQDDLYSKWSAATNYFYYNDVLGIDEPSIKKVILWGSERDLFEGTIGLKAKIINWLTNTVFLNSFKMGEDNMNHYIKTINSYRPDLIRGYTGSLYEICRYLERKGVNIYTPKILISAAETLREDMRKKIETVFKTKLYDFYGSREVNGMAGECKEGFMHVFLFMNYFEVLDSNDQPVGEGEEGRVIVTNLHNYSMPLIRYEIGDMAVIGPKECKCRNVLPSLKKITGRITDHFILENGTTIPAEYFIHLIGVVCNKGFIRKFQVIQEDYKKIRILVIPERVIEESEKIDIEDKIKLVMGQDCKIIWEFVKEIPRIESGKYLYTKSLVWR
jgi:phenylacetate-CoA ligase